MKEKTDINKIVKVQDGEITVLKYAFKYEDGTKGLTGTIFEPVSKAWYKENTKLSAIEQRLRDSVSEEEVPFEFREHHSGFYKNPYLKWAKAIKDNDEAGEFMFDCSYIKLWDYLRTELNLSEKEAYVFNCIGGGRCFNVNDEFTHNKELEKYLEYERK